MATLPKKLYDYFSLDQFMSVPAKPIEGEYWLDKDGRFTYDKDQVLKKIPAKMPQIKLAESEDEFDLMFRQFRSHAGLPTSPENNRLMAEGMIRELKRLIETHKDFGGVTNWNWTLISLAEQFIAWAKAQFLEITTFQPTPHRSYKNTYLNQKFSIEFGTIPDGIINAFIVNYFDFVLLMETGRDSFANWESNVRKSLHELPADVQPQAMIKGIEYAEKAARVDTRYLKNDHDGQLRRNSWERRKLISRKILQDITTQTTATSQVTLLDLKDDNPVHHRLVTAFAEKISNITALGMSKKDFIKAELARIDKMFLQPISVGSADPFLRQWSNDRYRKRAYDILTQGHNYPVRQLLDNAEKEYRGDSAYPVSDDDVVTTRLSIRSFLMEGVAYVLYEQFLIREQRASSRNTADLDADTSITLEALFRHLEDYPKIIALLVNQGLIDPRTYRWNTQVGLKSMAATLIRDLEAKSYLKATVRLGPSLIKQIVLNTFGFALSKDSCTNRRDSKKHDLSFIPIAT